jgi:hypothetical protein
MHLISYKKERLNNMTLKPEDVQGLKHYGVSGMKWGTRHKYRTAIARSVSNQDTSDSYRNKAINTSFKATKKEQKLVILS